MSPKNGVINWFVGVAALLLIAPVPLRAQQCPDECDDGNVCTDDACVSGHCQFTNNVAPCDDGNACTSNDTCSSGICVAGTALVCNDNNPCTDDTCAPATGCVYTNDNTNSCIDGNACNGTETCLAGVCQAGTALVCNDNNPCTDDTCAPATGCVYTNNNTNSCIDGNACNGTETCLAGVCQAGTALVCNDNNPCTDDTCAPATGCVYTNDNTNSCIDGNACNGTETCLAGVCQAGTALVCNDNNPCTDDTCAPATGCVYTNDNTNSCIDGNACNGTETCLAGVCQAGTALVCNDNNPCTDDTCAPATGCVYTNNNTNTCSDGSACTTNDTCSGGTCVGGAAPNCDDGNVCTDDTCNPATGCTHTNNFAPCSDGNACNGTETCLAGVCQAGTALVCNDNNPCTDDTCAPTTGCVYTNDNTNSCSDGNICNGTETCLAGVCQAGTALVCNDNNLCTDDACAPATGCTHTNNVAPCNDGNACTTSDACSGGTCVGGASPNCDDANVCTNDSCNPASGCVHIDNTFPCNDGNDCTITDVCAGGTCVGSGSPNCGDGNLCTNDSCNPAGGCVHVNNTSPCNDEDACTTNDTCSGGTCAGAPIPDCQDECTEPSQCDDGNVCTTDTCPAGFCVFVNNTDPCDDGNACTTHDTCAEGLCRIGVSVDCSGAGDACNTASCDPNGAEGNCTIATPIADGTACDDGDHCTAVEECVNGACVEDLPADDDPYRCVGLEWRQSGPASYNVGDTVLLSLYAVADGCNMPSSGCPLGGHPIWHIYTILEWDPAVLQLQTPTTGNPNPADPCDDVNCAVACPANAYNWFYSGFPNDCSHDQLNQPCNGFPSNDGDAYYLSSAYTTCTAVPLACASPSGLEVTTFKFKVLGIPTGGATQVSLMPCIGDYFTKSEVISRMPRPPGYRTIDVTKWLGPAATILTSCNNNAECADPDLCTIDACVAGNCWHTDVNCDDGVACTTDTCVHPSGTCMHAPNNAFCNTTGSYCSSAACDPPPCPGGVCNPPVTGCVLDHECISDNGNPCPDPATCNETTNTCGGCNQPIMVAAGPRYLAVTPADQGSTPVALLVTGDCADPVAACVSRYVQSKCNGGPNNGQNCDTDADCPKRCVGGQFPNANCAIATDCPQGECAGRCDAGTLGPTPYYKLSSLWGTANVRGSQIRPGTTYMVHAECNFGGPPVLSSAASAKTWMWGDVNNNGIVNAIDVVNLVNAFKGRFGPFTFEQLNLFGCVPDDVINALDITICVDVVKGFPYPCSNVCP